MSATDTSYFLNKNKMTANKKEEDNIQKVYRYLDIDSSYRNRNVYSNPFDFVLPITLNSGTLKALSSFDPISNAVPYTGSTLPPGSNVTQVSTSTTLITLGVNEPSIDNYYNNVSSSSNNFSSKGNRTILQIGTDFRNLISYNGTTKVATVDVPFTVLPAAGTVYYTRLAIPILQTTVGASPAPTVNSFVLVGGSNVSGSYVGEFVRFTSGTDFGITAIVQSYDGPSQTVTLSTSLLTAPSPGDGVEVDTFSRDNANSLQYSGVKSQMGFYEIELLWISIPNLTLKTGYGGTIDRYPYLYVNLYNEGSPETKQAMYSNNPNSSNALFKVPVNEYYGDTSFVALKNSKMSQTVRFEPNKDLRFTITHSDGTPVQLAQTDTTSPIFPNPLLQVNAAFSLRYIN